MITIRDSVATALSPAEALDYLSNFEHTAEWDPGTPVVDKLTPGPVAIGSRYRAEAEFRGKRQEIEYQVTELEPDRVKLRGENKTVISIDTIEVRSAGVGSLVTYTAEFTLKGLFKLATPFVGGMFRALTAPAMAGLKNKLDSLVV